MHFYAACQKHLLGTLCLKEIYFICYISFSKWICWVIHNLLKSGSLLKLKQTHVRKIKNAYNKASLHAILVKYYLHSVISSSYRFLFPFYAVFIPFVNYFLVLQCLYIPVKPACIFIAIYSYISIQLVTQHYSSYCKSIFGFNCHFYSSNL